MTLSSHTAPDVRPLLERLCLVHRLLLFPVGQWPRPNNAAPSLQPHYRAFDATTGCSAPAPRFGTLALAVGAACGLSFHVLGRDEAQVLTFHTKAWSSFAPPTCRMPLGQYPGIPPPAPARRGPPPVLTSPNPLSPLLQRFACPRPSRPCLPKSCSGVSATLPSRPGEFHPEPLTDPDVILSHHPARATE